VKHLATLLFALTILTLLATSSDHAQQLVFSMEDPVGDDNGPGTYTYPTNPVFTSGVFDLVKFEVLYDAGYVVFRTYVRTLGGNPWGGPNGFSLQYVHIYVYTTLNIPPSRMTVGLNVELDPGWHFAVLLSGGWTPGPVPDGEESAIRYANGTAIGQAGYGGLFDVRADPATNMIEARIYQSLLPDVEHMGAWMYAVFIASYDGPRLDKVRPVQPGEPDVWIVGGGDPEAVNAGVEPRIMDMLAKTAEEQYRALKTYDAKTGRLAIAEMIGPETPVTVTLTTPPNVPTPSPPTQLTTSPPTTETPRTETPSTSPVSSPTPQTTTIPPQTTTPSPAPPPSTPNPTRPSREALAALLIALTAIAIILTVALLLPKR